MEILHLGKAFDQILGTVHAALRLPPTLFFLFNFMCLAGHILCNI